MPLEHMTTETFLQLSRLTHDNYKKEEISTLYIRTNNL